MPPDILELQIFGVYDRGVPNAERIVLRPLIALDLANYALTLGVRTPRGAWPTTDHYFWLGSYLIEPPSWIFVYTGPGRPKVTHESQTKEPVHVMHWNKPEVVFQNPDVVPVLLRFDGLQIGSQPPRSVSDVYPYQTALPLTLKSLMAKK